MEKDFSDKKEIFSNENSGLQQQIMQLRKVNQEYKY